MLKRGGRLVLVVADQELWPSARAFLAQRLPDEAFVEHVADSRAAAGLAIEDPARDRPGCSIIIRVNAPQDDVITVLNTRREQLSRAAASFVIVLGGEDTYHWFLTYAPDCYSYRDLLVSLEGETRRRATNEHRAIELSVKDLVHHASSAGRHVTASRLLAVTRRPGSLHSEPAQQALEEAAQSLLSSPELAPEDRSLLAEIYAAPTERSSHAMRARRIGRAIELLQPAASRYPDAYEDLCGRVLDALGPDLEVAREMFERGQHHETAAARLLARAYHVRGNELAAHKVLDHVQPDVDTTELHAELRYSMGDWPGAKYARMAEEDEPPLRSRMLMQRGESEVARSLFASAVPRFHTRAMHAELDVQDGRLPEARAALEHSIDEDLTAELTELGDPVSDRLLRSCHLLDELTEAELALGSSPQIADALDQRLERIGHRIERADLAPHWDAVHFQLLRADVSLRRAGGAEAALGHAEQALSLAERAAPLLSPLALRRLIVAALRARAFANIPGWLELGLARSRQHEFLAAEAELLGLALWHDTVTGCEPAVAEARLMQTLRDSGSMLLRASIYLRLGRAIDRKDLLRRAQQIYRSLPWPAREGACLEALGERDAARRRYQTYKLVYCERLLDRATPAPITAVDDELR
ncbi:MAG TPA: hypothetical protein VGC42_26680 [Kofleriaceae bacterium]